MTDQAQEKAMKRIVIVYGHQRKGSTWNVVRLLKDTLEKSGDVTFSEFMMPKDLPRFCRGCFTCILKDENKCPDSQEILPIRNAMLEADGIILASPVHCLDVSVGMKNLIDHMAYMWMPHRPKEEMFDKIGLVVSTAAGAGMKRTNQTMRKALVFMGVKRVRTLGFAVQAASFDEIPPKITARIVSKTERTATSFMKDVSRRHGMAPTLFHRILKKAMGAMIKGYDKENIDKAYWVEKGWIK
jgi:multimeric flavodoxin WrbA